MSSEASVKEGIGQGTEQKSGGSMSLSSNPEGDPHGDHQNRAIKAQEDHLKSQALGISLGGAGYSQHCPA